MRKPVLVSALLVTSMVLAYVGVPYADSQTSIMEIQGAGHISPLLHDERDREEIGDEGDLREYRSRRPVTTTGIVTAVSDKGFYLQDPTGDGDDKTSDAIFVFKRGELPSVGDRVRVTARVSEFFGGNQSSGGLSVTQLTRATCRKLDDRRHELPAPVVIGRSGRVPPHEFVISASETPVNLQNPAEAAANRFNPDPVTGDGIDFYESLEGMRVTVEQPITISALQSYGRNSSEVYTLANSGNDATPADARTARGGIAIPANPDEQGVDQNPERIQLQFDRSLYSDDPPKLAVGTQLGDVNGVMGYSYGNFEVNVTDSLEVSSESVEPEKTELSKGDEAVTIVSYNVLNHSADSSDDRQRRTLANHIVDRLGGPDILALQEIQDNSGEEDDGTVAADRTLGKLIEAIVARGGPQYDFIDIAPADGSTGGVPGGNIRCAYLYNPARVQVEQTKLIDRQVLTAIGGSEPGAFDGTRKPLLVQFKFGDRQFAVINNHWSSRFGSTPIFGGTQPFVRSNGPARASQAKSLHQFVKSWIRTSGIDRVIVLGDLNTFAKTVELSVLLPFGETGKNRGVDPLLFNLIETIEKNAYTYIFEGNSQALDHVFVTKALVDNAELDIVHVNVDFPSNSTAVASDHEPLVLRLSFDD